MSNIEFHDTKAGVLPTHWIFTQIQDVSSLVTNGFVGTATPHYTDKDDGVIYIQGYNVRENKIDLTGVTHVTPEFAYKQKKSILRTGDMLTVQSGHIGTTAVVPPGLNGANCHAVIITRFDKEVVNPYYIAYYLNSSYGKKRLKALEVGSSVLHINTKELKKFYIPLPPLPKQRKIAAILSTWDEAIALTDQLIAALQERKKGLMQRLLTGEVRFPGFEGEWEEVLLGNVSKYIKGYSYKSSDYAENESPYNFITLKCIGKGGGFQKSGLKYLKNDVEDRFHVARGDLIFANTDITREAEVVGAPILIPELDGIRKIISMDLTKVELSPMIDKMFFYYLMQTSGIRNFFRSRASGSTVLHLDVQGTKKLRFRIPLTIGEQRVISSLLSSIDHEIDLLNNYFFLLTAQKKGLMQRLLTGEVRVGVEE